MKEIERTIASVLIFSSDGKLLMGQKDPLAGGVYADCWHIPGGGVDEGESLTAAAIREAKEEVGIMLSEEQLVPVAEVGAGTSEKTLKETGEVVLCHMKFHRFEVQLAEPAEAVALILGDDLVTAEWFSKEELATVKQIPGGREFFIRQGYITI